MPSASPTVEGRAAKRALYRRWWFLLLLALVIGLPALGIGVPACTHGGSGPLPAIDLGNPPRTSPAEEMVVLSLNLAHGRGRGRNQLLQSDESIERRVAAIAELLVRERPDLVACQEADAPSWWSGGFSHVERIGRRGGLARAVHARNVDGLGLHYGTAVLAALPLEEGEGVTFPLTPPTFSKGCAVAACTWPGRPELVFDVVSLHLDFASDKAREEQLAAVADLLRRRDRPAVVMGDFNLDVGDPVLNAFIAETGLRAWRPESDTPVSFPAFGSRIDWILISPGFRFVDYRALDDVVSDHCAVRAIIAPAEGSR